MFNPHNTWMFDQPRAYWEEYAKKMWVEIGNPLPEPGDQRFDAFRHAFTSATWTRHFGESAAKAGGDFIEGMNSRNFDRGEAGTRDMNGDQLNNAEGRELGKEAHPGWTQETLAKETFNLLNSGRLVVDPLGDNRTLPENFPPHLEVPQFRSRMDWANHIIGKITDSLSDLFRSALNWLFPKDPLTLDLDGDGIESTGIDASNPILFDHNGDGIKTATGWIKADDGLVVLDLNNNGVIDSGRELFGDNTVLANGSQAGQLAANGFAALADLDVDGNGKLDAQDAAFAKLRIWQDSNQDGVSQSTELKTLAQHGITSISVLATETNTNLGNGGPEAPTLTHFVCSLPPKGARSALGRPGGGTQPLGATYTKANGSTGTAGTVELASGSLNLASNNFYREFTDNPTLTEAAKALPQMGGSGVVRDLREAKAARQCLRRHSKRLHGQTFEQKRFVASVFVQRFAS